MIRPQPAQRPASGAHDTAPGSIRSVALVGMGARTGRVPARVCANLMWTGYTLFHDHTFAAYDDLRATIVAQLDDIENAPVDKPVRTEPHRRAGSHR